MKTIKNLITNNLILKLVSVLLACMLWFLVAELGDPKDTKYYNNITVRLTNTSLLDDENKFYEILDNTNIVRVGVTAPRSVIDNLRATDIIAEADVSKLTDINTIAISYYVPNVDYSAIVGDHDVVRLSVEEKASKWIPLRCNTVGDVAEGYIVYSATSDQTQIEVSGPKSVIDQIAYASVEINVEGATTNTTAQMFYSLYNSEKGRVSQTRVTKNVSQVHVNVEVLATKEVPVEVAYSGEPAEGYLATGRVESNVTTLVLAGAKDDLADISKVVIPKEDVDITDAEETVTRILDLKKYLPSAVKIADSTQSSKIMISVPIEPIVERTLDVNVENLSFLRLPEDVTARVELTDKPYQITVSGLSDRIRPLQASSIHGTIDVKSWMDAKNLSELRPGVYDMPIVFSFVNEIQLRETLFVKVLIEEKME